LSDFAFFLKPLCEHRFSNNHPFFCFWWADPRHPLGSSERIVNLLASLAFGLAATCLVVLWFFYEDERDFDDVAFSIFGYMDVTVGMLALMLFSGPLHVLFDLSMYFLQACPPCRVDGFFDRHFPSAHQTFWLWIGKHLAFLITAASMALAFTVMLIRASVDSGGDGDDISSKAMISCYFTYWKFLFPTLSRFQLEHLRSSREFSGAAEDSPALAVAPIRFENTSECSTQKRWKFRCHMLTYRIICIES
jgi:hypothetical protein